MSGAEPPSDDWKFGVWLSGGSQLSHHFSAYGRPFQAVTPRGERDHQIDAVELAFNPSYRLGQSHWWLSPEIVLEYNAAELYQDQLYGDAYVWDNRSVDAGLIFAARYYFGEDKVFLDGGIGVSNLLNSSGKSTMVTDPKSGEPLHTVFPENAEEKGSYPSPHRVSPVVQGGVGAGPLRVGVEWQPGTRSQGVRAKESVVEVEVGVDVVELVQELVQLGKKAKDKLEANRGKPEEEQPAVPETVKPMPEPVPEEEKISFREKRYKKQLQRIDFVVFERTLGELAAYNLETLDSLSPRGTLKLRKLEKALGIDLDRGPLDRVFEQLLIANFYCNYLLKAEALAYQRTLSNEAVTGIERKLKERLGEIKVLLVADPAKPVEEKITELNTHYAALRTITEKLETAKLAADREEEDAAVLDQAVKEEKRRFIAVLSTENAQIDGSSGQIVQAYLDWNRVAVGLQAHIEKADGSTKKVYEDALTELNNWSQAEIKRVTGQEATVADLFLEGGRMAVLSERQKKLMEGLDTLSLEVLEARKGEMVAIRKECTQYARLLEQLAVKAEKIEKAANKQAKLERYRKVLATLNAEIKKHKQSADQKAKAMAQEEVAETIAAEAKPVSRDDAEKINAKITEHIRSGDFMIQTSQGITVEDLSKVRVKIFFKNGQYNRCEISRVPFGLKREADEIREVWDETLNEMALKIPQTEGEYYHNRRRVLPWLHPTPTNRWSFN